VEDIMLEREKADKRVSTESILLGVLAHLRLLQQQHYTAHWAMEGEPFYGDHLLFERLYENLSDEFDTLAEKIVCFYGSDAVGLQDQMHQMENMSRNWDAIDCPVHRSIVAEEKLQDRLEVAYDKISDRGDMTLGLDDYIMALANDHETHLYLLNQKLRCDCENH
jgi:DNA-binding ferritin-like protein